MVLCPSARPYWLKELKVVAANPYKANTTNIFKHQAPESIEPYNRTGCLDNSWMSRTNLKNMCSVTVVRVHDGHVNYNF